MIHETTRNSTNQDTRTCFASSSCRFVWFRGSFPYMSHFIKTDLEALHLPPDGRLDGYALRQVPPPGLQRPLAGVSHLFAGSLRPPEVFDDLVGDARRRLGRGERREVEG